MTGNLQQLIQDYYKHGRISDLPTDLFIDGKYCAGSNNEQMESFDPGLAQAFASFACATEEDVERAVVSSEKAYRNVWRKTLPAERSRLLNRAAALLRKNSDLLSVTETIDSGKTLAEAQGDINSSARLLEYYAGAADKLEGETFPLGPDYLSFSLHEPVGVTAHIIPWNYPTSTMIRGIAPALAAGCTAIVKPAETTPFTALLIAGIFKQAGFPDGVLNVINGTGANAGAPLVSHPKVRHVTFTGSVDTGINVMKAAASNVASVTLELGGKSPIIALSDCDMDAAAEGTLWAIFSNAGQICSAGSRLIVERSIHQQLLEKIVEKAKGLSLGHGLRNPSVGAISSELQLGKIDEFLVDAKKRGITIAHGGNKTHDPETGKGWFFEPTILDQISPDDRLIQQEIFGPVLSVQVVDTTDEALDLANGTDFGLAAGIYTRDISKALRLARDIDAGQLYINEYFAGGVEVPFGGNKLSGFGREKGLEALRSYCRVKAVTAKI
ncbi:aldehyde dehydrogenase family protein [Kiloniella laminariae]|uniref:Aldehyde dehydrogenase family protein n=1 Tax=Kiloniella laminariae TaxID=454162 RepID=A0ABT4LMD0_9PROT|nr:aldehyde dehydrogenase family protein [Kiloniella laminariae]MCZ4282266.1 aldehyde dehydrogenase family protein [Kiloniella laminariae]